MKDALNDTNKMEQLTKNLGFAEEDVRSGKVKSIDIFNRVAQAIGTQTNDTQKLAIATAFFGDKVANDMLPVLETIAKNPDIFKGLVTGTEEAYKKIDELDTRFQKFWHNIKRGVAESLTGQDQFYSNAAKAGMTKEEAMRLRSMMGIAGDVSLFSAMNQNDAVNSAFGKSNAPAVAQVTKAQADAIAASSNKTVKGDNTIANSLGASMGNGPTSGVIGVGNNAMSLIMQDQLDTLKQIKESIDRLGTPQGMNTDFTKQQYPAV
jgi:hypothetical protein